MTNLLVIAEHDGGKLSAVTLNTVSAARRLLAVGDGGGEIHMLVTGHDCEPVADVAARIAGVSRVLLADDRALAEATVEVLAPVVATRASEYGHVIAPASSFGRDLLPRVAALLDVAPLTDVIRIDSVDTFVRPLYAGNVLATVRSLDRTIVLTVRPTAFAAAGPQDEAAPIEPIAFALPPEAMGLSRRLSRPVGPQGRPELGTARVVVAGGRGVAGREGFHLLEEIADRLDAAIGATRAAVDAGFISNDHQVGQTGKVVAPELYIAVGISGAIQHLAGMRDSKVIVAINKDEDAPIFQVADYGLVADLFEALPELRAQLDSLRL